MVFLITAFIISSALSQVHFFNSFFHKQLVAKGYEGVKRWTKKVRRLILEIYLFLTINNTQYLSRCSRKNIKDLNLQCSTDRNRTATKINMLKVFIT